VRYVDVAAPWLGDVGGDVHAAPCSRPLSSPESPSATTRPRPTSCTTRSSRPCCSRSPTRSTCPRSIQVDYDDRDLASPRSAAGCRATDSRQHASQRAGRSSPTSSGTCAITSPATCRSRSRPTPTLKLYGRPAASAEEEFRARCEHAADDRADAEIAALRDKYEAQGHEAARPDRCRRGSMLRCSPRRRRGRRRRSSSRPQDRCSVVSWAASKSKTKMVGDLLGDAGTAASATAWQLQRIRPSSRCRREQGAAPRRPVRRTRSRPRARGCRHLGAAGTRPQRTSLTIGDRAGAHRCECHASRARLAPGRLIGPTPVPTERLELSLTAT
jgi:hypothetical protein